jgi:hypothetical protein
MQFLKFYAGGIMKRLLLTILPALYAIASYAQTDTSRYKIYFNSGRYQLTSTHKNELSMFFDTLLPFPPSSVLITGSADEDGPTPFNYQLGLKRAQALQSFIEGSGVSSSIIQTTSLGEGSPATLKGNNKRLNRYAEITFIIPRPQDTIASVALPEDDPGNIADLYALLRQKPQEFCIDITRDTFLIGNKGTIVEYKANTIKATDINCQCFTLLLNEYYDNSELVLNNLTTTSDGQALESGGMIRLQGFCDNQPYKLKPGQSFTVMVPSDTILPGMKLLSANRDSDSAYLNWKIDPDSQLDDFDVKCMFRCIYQNSDPNKCHLFFCKIGRFVGWLFNGKPKNPYGEMGEALEKEKGLMRTYQLNGDDLATALRESRKKAGKEVLKYYVFKNTDWDYRNIDRWKNGNVFTDLVVDNKPLRDQDVKLIFRSSRTSIPALDKKDHYLFDDVPAAENVWMIGLRYTRNRRIFLAMQETSTSAKKLALDFREISIEELKAKLKMLDQR